MTMTAALVAQISNATNPAGSYCLVIKDTGSLTVPLNFVIYITHS